jgi:hypothetical protein
VPSTIDRGGIGDGLGCRLLIARPKVHFSVRTVRRRLIAINRERLSAVLGVPEDRLLDQVPVDVLERALLAAGYEQEPV